MNHESFLSNVLSNGFTFSIHIKQKPEWFLDSELQNFSLAQLLLFTILCRLLTHSFYTSEWVRSKCLSSCNDDIMCFVG